MRWMKRALLLAALASIVAVGPGIGPAPAVAAEAGAAVEFEWSYRYAGGKAGRAAVEQAVDEVVADMNVMIRGIARRKLHRRASHRRAPTTGRVQPIWPLGRVLHIPQFRKASSFLDTLNLPVGPGNPCPT